MFGLPCGQGQRVQVALRRVWNATEGSLALQDKIAKWANRPRAISESACDDDFLDVPNGHGCPAFDGRGGEPAVIWAERYGTVCEMRSRTVLLAGDIPDGESVSDVSKDQRARLIKGSEVGPSGANFCELSSRA